MKNGCRKGKVGEREWRDVLIAHGYEARRGQQFSGSKDSPDVVHNIRWIHFEVKRVESLNIHEAIKQAREDSGHKLPIVAHRRNKGRWMVTMDSESFFIMLRRANA